MKICQYFRLHMKIVLKILHLNTFCFLRYSHVWYVKSLFTNIPKQWNMLKISLLFKKFTNFSRILRIKNVKFLGYCFCMNTNIWGDFQICISVPLKEVSYLSWQNTYPNLKTTCHMKLKFFLWIKLLEKVLLAKNLISATASLMVWIIP